MQREICDTEGGVLMDECCGNCKHHQYEDASQGWVCCNPDSECCADWTEYDDVCEEFEERD